MAGRAIVNAMVHVMDTPGHVESALLWRGDTIEAVGSDSKIRALAARAGLVAEDLGGRVVLPGFVDAHTHFLHVGLKQTRPDLRGARSLEDALSRLTAWLRAHPGDTAVIGDGWDESEWTHPTRPTRTDIDAAARAAGAAGRPVLLRRIDGHTAIAGSAALPALRRRWPAAGLVDEATGTLLEDPSLYVNEVFPASAAELDAALELAQRQAHRLGVTAVGDYEQAPYRAAVQRAAAAGRLAVRVFASIYPQQLEAELAAGFRTGRPAPGAAGAWLRDGGLKVFLDGSLGAHTAHLREPYMDGPPPGAACTHAHPRGTPIWNDAEVARLFGTAHGADVQIHAHAIGDAAIDQGLAAFGRLAGEGMPGSRHRLRHRFEHYEIVHDEQVARTVAAGVTASSQPNFVGTWSAKGGMYEERLGERFHLNNRFQSFKRAGLRVAFGSDGMPFGPAVGIQAALEHPRREERLPIEDAVWHYTREAAWAIHWEDRIGTLEAGKLADLVVLDQTRLGAAPPREWRIRQCTTGGVDRLALGGH